MKLKEFEGKLLLSNSDISIPNSILITKKEEISNLKLENKVIKAQILQGKRGKNGGILFSNSIKNTIELSEKLLGSTILGEEVEEILIEDKLEIKKEFYMGFLFDTKLRAPILILSKNGGIDIEEVKEKNPEEIFTKEIDVLEGLNYKIIEKILNEFKFESNSISELSNVISKLYLCFVENDMKMLEINPLVQTKSNEFIAADCVAVLDDNALFRHNFKFPPRHGNRKKTQREIKATQISDSDHKGVAGKVFIELDGDIAVLASGGGASIVAMDALETYGGKAANYTEYSGNPTLEKVYELTKLTLNKEGLNGCYVVGGRANFTRIDITLNAFLKALIEIKPRYPILIRREGPGYEEAHKLLREAAKKYNLSMHICETNVSISESAKIMTKLVEEYKNK